MVNIDAVTMAATQLIRLIVTVRQRQQVIACCPGKCAYTDTDKRRLDMQAIGEVIKINTRHMDVSNVSQQHGIFSDVKCVIKPDSKVIDSPERHSHKFDTLVKIRR